MTNDLEALAREHEEKADALEADAVKWRSNAPAEGSYPYDVAMRRDADALAHRQAAALIRAKAPGREEISDADVSRVIDTFNEGLNLRSIEAFEASRIPAMRAALSLFHAPAEAGGGEAWKPLLSEAVKALDEAEIVVAGSYGDRDFDAYVSLITRIKAALASPTPPAGDGWRMVPSGDMTPAMCDAALAYIDGLSTEIQFRFPGGFNWHDLYRAMLAAAPTPPAKEPG